MKKTVLLKPIIIASLALCASANSFAWQNGPGPGQPYPYPYNPPQAWGWPQQPPSAYRDSFEARLQNHELRINEMYQELQGAKALLQQSSEALFRAQAEYQQNAVTATQSLAQQQSNSDLEIERLRKLTEKLETQHASLRTELNSKEEVIATLTQELESARNAEHEGQARLGQQEVELGKLAAELEKSHSQTQQLHSEKFMLAKQLHASKQMLEKTSAESNQHGEKLVSLQSELQRVREAARETKTNTGDQNEKLQRLLAERGQQLVSISAELESARSELRSIRLESSQSDQTLNEVNEKLASAKVASARMQSLLNQSLATTKQQEEKISACETNLTQVQSNCKTAQAATTEPAAIEVAQPSPPSAPQRKSIKSKAIDSDGDGLSDAVDLCANTPTGVEIGASGCKLDASISLQGVKFSYDSDELTSESITLLDQIARVLQKHPKLTHEVAGHTDTQGNAAYNVWLSQRRATAVKNHLISRGIKPRQLVAVGYGGEQPIGDNSTWNGLIKNRRVELRWLP